MILKILVLVIETFGSKVIVKLKRSLIMILYFVEPQLYGENVSESYSYEEPKHIVVRGSPTKLEEAYLWK